MKKKNEITLNAENVNILFSLSPSISKTLFELLTYMNEYYFIAMSGTFKSILAEKIGLATVTIHKTLNVCVDKNIMIKVRSNPSVYMFNPHLFLNVHGNKSTKAQDLTVINDEGKFKINPEIKLQYAQMLEGPFFDYF